MLNNVENGLYLFRNLKCTVLGLCNSRQQLCLIAEHDVCFLLNAFLIFKSFYRVILPFLKKNSKISMKQKSYSHGLCSKYFFIFFFLDMILYATISKINRVIRDASSVLILGFWVASGV